MKAGKIANWSAFGLLIVCFTFSLVRVIGTHRKQSDPEVTYLRVATWYLVPGMPEAFEELAAEYSRMNPGVVVEQVLVHWQLYPMWLRTKLVGGNAPDIAMFPNQVRNETIVRYMHPLSDYVDRVNPYNVGTDLEGEPWRQTFLNGLSSWPAFVEDVMEYYSVPTMLNTSRFYYNKDLYRDLFGDRRLPETADEFFQLCEDTYLYSEAAGKDIAPITASRDRATEIVGFFFEYMTQKLLDRLDPDLDLLLSPRDLAVAYRQGNWSLETPDIQAGFELVQRAGRYFQQGFMHMQRNEAVFAFSQGQALMYMSGPYDARSIKSDSFFELGIFDFPVPDVSDPRYAPYVKGRPSEAGQRTSQNLGVYKLSPNVDQAVDFLMFLSSKSSMKRWICDADRIAPVRNVEPNPLVAKFAPHVNGYLRGFRINFSNYGIGLTGSAYESNLHQLINLKGQDDKTGSRALFTRQLEAIYDDSLARDMRADYENAEKVVMKNDSIIAYFLVKTAAEDDVESLDAEKFHRLLELQQLQTAANFQLESVLE